MYDKLYPLYAGFAEQALGFIGIKRGKYALKRALENIDITIHKGEKVGLIGHNGSGKTTLLRIISGYTEVTNGNVYMNGNVQALLQKGYAFNDALSGLENIENALVYNGIKKAAAKEALREITEFVELGDFINYPVRTYSLGMRARLEFAAATAIRTRYTDN